MKIGKLKKMLSKKKHKKAMDKTADYLAGKLDGAKEEREKINAEIAITNKANIELEKMASEQEANALKIANKRIYQKIKDGEAKLAAQLEEFKKLDDIKNKPLEDKVETLKQELANEVTIAKEKNIEFEKMIEQTEEILEQIQYIYKPFEQVFSEVIHKINKVSVIVGRVKDAQRHLKNIKRKKDKEGIIKKMPKLSIKDKS